MDFETKQQTTYLEQLTALVTDSHGTQFPDYSLVPSPSSPHLLCLSPETMLDHLDLAIEQKHLLIDNETFYVYDLSKEKSTPYNTLVFQLNGSPLKTLETTTKVMDRYFDYINVDYRWVRQFGHALNVKKCCPFVLGSHYLTPDSGAIRKHANWIAFHHVLDFYPHGNRTFFNIAGHHQLVSKRSYKHMLHLAHQTRLLAESQDKITREWLTLLANQAGTYSQNNIINRLSTPSVFTQPSPPLSSWMMKLIFFQAKYLLLGLLKEGDPLIDELKKKHEKDLLDDEEEDDS
ncbi:hypothetical protein ACO1PF_10210 [Alkalibacterium sp. f15]|uniref:hypothetical protein n=1 Tax=Alkalibacterium sp. f15 TaxID=3414029 RepID=UPI003BF7D582